MILSASDMIADTPPAYSASSNGTLIDKKEAPQAEWKAATSKEAVAESTSQIPQAESKDVTTRQAVDSTQDESERQFRALLEQLRSAIAAYKAARSGGRDEATMKRHQSEVLGLMKKVANAAPEPRVRFHYLEKARMFSKANVKEKDGVLRDVGKGVSIILLAPLAITAAVLYVAGAILQGTGSIVKGMGDAFNVGKVKKWGKGKQKGSNDASWDIE